MATQMRSPPESPIAPASLCRLQEAFGRAIAAPFVFDSTPDGQGGDYQLDIDSYDAELVADIRPRGTTSPHERLGIYNQQYWFRLLSTMQEEYPVTERILGTLEFNKMVMAYLTRFPPDSYTLTHLSDRLGQFLTHQHRWNRGLIRESAGLEYLFIRAFDAPERPAFHPSSQTEYHRDEILAQPIGLQPHWFLFEEHWNLVECRQAIKQEGVATITPVARHGHWAVYRGPDGPRAHRLNWLQARLLDALHRGTPLGQACDELVETLDGNDVQELAGNIGTWFARWVAMGWFASPSVEPAR